MFTPDITIGTKTYSLTTQKPLGSIRSDAAAALSNPRQLTISHELSKTKRSSVVIVSDTLSVPVTGALPATDSIRVMLKLQYDPFAGRTTTEADVKAAIDELVAFLTVANVDKILNLES